MISPASTVSQALPPGADPRLQTRAAVLDAAERLFATHGVDGTSVRDITAAAGANLGAINYHFGSKDRLVLEVFARRLGPVNRARLARLDVLEAASGGEPVELSQLVEAVVRPSVESEACGGSAEEPFMQLLSRCFQEPHPELKKFVEEQFGELAKRFDAAILRAVPGLTPDELSWRMSFFIGALHHSLARWLRFDNYPKCGAGSDATRPDREPFIRAITAFVTAGMRAPASKFPSDFANRSRPAPFAPIPL